MARVRPPFQEFHQYLRKEGLIDKWGDVRAYDEFKPKRMYERVDGKFVGVAWKIWYYGHDYFDITEIVILDSALS